MFNGMSLDDVDGAPMGAKLDAATRRLLGDHDGSSLGSTYGRVNGMLLGDAGGAYMGAKIDVSDGRLPEDNE